MLILNDVAKTFRKRGEVGDKERRCKNVGFTDRLHTNRTACNRQNNNFPNILCKWCEDLYSFKMICVNILCWFVLCFLKWWKNKRNVFCISGHIGCLCFTLNSKSFKGRDSGWSPKIFLDVIMQYLVICHSMIQFMGYILDLKL